MKFFQFSLMLSVRAATGLWLEPNRHQPFRYARSFLTGKWLLSPDV